jgi:hypothetical protein
MATHNARNVPPMGLRVAITNALIFPKIPDVLVQFSAIDRAGCAT